MPVFDHLHVLCVKTINKGEEVGIFFILGVISMAILRGEKGRSSSPNDLEPFL